MTKTIINAQGSSKQLKLPEPFISGSMLKILAMATMLIDHTASYILSQFDFFTNPLFNISSKGISTYFILRMIGRLAFPLYAFLLVEGFIHTKNRLKYGIRLLAFAIISEIAWNFVHTGELFCSSQNTIFTLFFGYLALCALEYLDKDKIKQIFSLIALFLICSFCSVDYGAKGLGVILTLYLLRDRRLLQAIITSSMLNNGWAAVFAFVPINFYNGKRGFMKGAVGKYIGYVFYPLHLLLLGIIKYYVL